MAPQTLHGSCACGRNRYVVEIPAQRELAELRYDNTAASRSHSASPLALWLRVPLGWYSSATFAQFPDEERTSIKRTFTSPFDSTNTRRQFCGFCGTQLTSWHERTHDDAEHICLSVGSLLDDDQAMLGELGYLPNAESSDEDTSVAGPSRHTHAVARPEPRSRGAPWFESMVEDTPLGRFKQQRGGHTAREGAVDVRVEWEVMEWTDADADDADDESATPSKRKLADVDAGDSEMRAV